jgi:hypothetical protein
VFSQAASHMTLKPLYQANEWNATSNYKNMWPMKYRLKKPHFNSSARLYWLKSLVTEMLRKYPPPPPPNKLVMFEFIGSNNVQLGEKKRLKYTYLLRRTFSWFYFRVVSRNLLRKTRGQCRQHVAWLICERSLRDVTATLTSVQVCHIYLYKANSL